MRRRWLTLLGLALGLCGCWSTNNQITKPPAPPPEWNLPPEADSRFTNPPSYPSSVMTTGQPRKPESTPMTPMGPGGSGSPSSRFGAGGMGAGMGR